MLRKFLGALLVLGACSASSVAGAVPIFDGTVAYITGNTCQAAGVTFSAIYRPQIGAEAAKSGLVISLYRQGVGFTPTGDGQFSGAGSFVMFAVTPEATLVNRAGAFQATQVPATVINTTQQITLTATFDPTVGCTYKFKGVFLRRPGT